MRSPLAKSAAILAAILVALLLAGTFADEAISQVLHDQANPFGIFLAAYGEAPASLMLVVSGTLLMLARNRARTGRAVGQIAGGVVLILLGTLMTAYMPTRYLDSNPVVLIGIGVVLVVAAIAFTVCLARDADRQAALRVSLVIFLVVLLEMILVNVVKVIWDRPRLRFLAEHPEISFRPWYAIGNPQMADAVASGVPTEEFKSFPSGHTANGAALMLLALLAPLKQGLARHQNLLFWIGAAWGLLVGLSRVIVGAHFVSDTVMGFTITLVLVLLGHRILQRQFATTPTLERATP